jgi:SAM-dependent methyltransferase
MNVKQTLIVRDAEDRDRDVKTNFDRIYLMDDPREYFRVLYGLDYIIPDLAAPIFEQIVRASSELRGRPVKVLDLGCSYGINAALLRFPLDIERLAQRYRDLQAAGLSSSEVVELDRSYYAGWPRSLPVELIGLDVSAPAIAYATASGLLDRGFAEDLENNDPSPALAAALADVDIVVSTGCIGYVGERTFARLSAAIRRPGLWVASFVLRLYGFEEIESCLSGRGLETERLDGVTFVQRRFHSEREYRESIAAIDARGIETLGKEDEGLMHAEFYLSRPRAERSRLPLERLVSVTSGASRPFGRRYRRHSDDVVRLIR